MAYCTTCGTQVNSGSFCTNCGTAAGAQRAGQPASQPIAQPSAQPIGANYQQPTSTNTLAIVSLVTSLLGIGLAGIICGHIALGQIKRTREQGYGLALAGLIIGYAGFVVVTLFIILMFAAMAINPNTYTNY